MDRMMSFNLYSSLCLEASSYFTKYLSRSLVRLFSSIASFLGRSDFLHISFSYNHVFREEMGAERVTKGLETKTFSILSEF